MSLSREKAKELRSSKMWEEFKSEIDSMIEGSRNLMEAEGKERFDYWQSRIKTLKEVRQIPEIVIDRES